MERVIGKASELWGRFWGWVTAYRTPGRSFVDCPGVLAIVVLSGVLAYSFLILTDLSYYDIPNGGYQLGYTVGETTDRGMDEPLDEAGGILVFVAGAVFLTSIVLRTALGKFKGGLKSSLIFSSLMGFMYGIFLLSGLNSDLFHGVRYCGEAATKQGCDVVATSIFSMQLLSQPFSLMLLTQGILFSFTAWVYTHPLVPRWIEDIYQENRESHARAHLSNWWRYTQVVLSVAAIAIAGLVIPVLLDQSGFGRGRILPMAITFIAPLGAILFFSVAKMHLIEDELTPSEGGPQ